MCNIGAKKAEFESKTTSTIIMTRKTNYVVLAYHRVGNWTGIIDSPKKVEWYAYRHTKYERRCFDYQLI